MGKQARSPDGWKSCRQTAVFRTSFDQPLFQDIFIQPFDLEGFGFLENRLFFLQIDPQALIEDKLGWVPEKPDELPDFNRFPIRRRLGKALSDERFSLWKMIVDLPGSLIVLLGIAEKPADRTFFEILRAEGLKAMPPNDLPADLSSRNPVSSFQVVQKLADQDRRRPQWIEPMAP